MAPKSKVRPLLSLAAASLCGACGSTPTAGSAPTITVDPAPSVAPVAATPRLMPSGRPACGNVATRAPPDPNCKPPHEGP